MLLQRGSERSVLWSSTTNGVKTPCQVVTTKEGEEAYMISSAGRPRDIRAFQWKW